jgi:hypothetical protein
MAALSARIAWRSTLIGLAAIAACSFTTAAILGNGRHGALKVVADVCWNAFLIAGLAVLLVGAAVLATGRSASRRPRDADTGR